MLVTDCVKTQSLRSPPRSRVCVRVECVMIAITCVHVCIAGVCVFVCADFSLICECVQEKRRAKNSLLSSSPLHLF